MSIRRDLLLGLRTAAADLAREASGRQSAVPPRSLQIMLISRTVPIDADDATRAAVTAEIAEMYSAAQEQGLDPTIMCVEPTSAGDVVAIDVPGDFDDLLDAS
jgi:hypothetical protein